MGMPEVRAEPMTAIERICSDRLEVVSMARLTGSSGSPLPVYSLCLLQHSNSELSYICYCDATVLWSPTSS